MANNHSTLTGLFTDIANAIRAKTGGTESIAADQFPEAIASIPEAFKQFVGTATTANGGWQLTWNNSLLGTPTQMFPDADIQIGDVLYSPAYNVIAWCSSSSYIKAMSTAVSAAGNIVIPNGTVFNIYR